MRAWFNGKTSACQVGDESSILSVRSRVAKGIEQPIGVLALPVEWATSDAVSRMNLREVGWREDILGICFLTLT